jgi:hypothetical protein
MRSPTRRRAYAPDPEAPGQPCDIPGCREAGEYRAPKSRSNLREYWWFCLEHVRAYNAAWDFYKGMTPGEIEAQMRADTSWQRPTWPLGRAGHVPLEDALRRDPLTLLSGSRRAARPASDAPEELREPLATLGLGWPTTLDEVKARYKALAKRHHPDANGGDKLSEERLKVVNIAYATLRKRLVAEPRLAAAG